MTSISTDPGGQATSGHSDGPSRCGGEAARLLARDAAVALERWGSERDWFGPDPYDGLNARLLPRAMRGWPLAMRGVTQAVKRSPLNLRPVLRVPNGLSAATLALLVSAYARNGFMDDRSAREKLQRCIERLEALRCGTYSEPCWGYHFDVQTRVFFYPQRTPNTIATAFAGLGLLDAYELAGQRQALALASGVAEFFIRHVPQTPTQSGAFFGYLPGDATPIHNANMLVSAFLARLVRASGRPDQRDAAMAALEYTISRQCPDGSWPYGEQPHLGWVDGLHTGYVLDSILTCIEAGLASAAAERAWQRGLRFYAEKLIERSGIPRYMPGSRYPIDGQYAAQAIETFARAASREPDIASGRWSVFSYARSRLVRTDGAFCFQRRRFWTSRIAHPRWVQAPMLRALALLAGTNS